MKYSRSHFLSRRWFLGWLRDRNGDGDLATATKFAEGRYSRLEFFHIDRKGFILGIRTITEGLSILPDLVLESEQHTAKVLRSDSEFQIGWREERDLHNGLMVSE
jgi:hypothetical protein